MPWYLQLFVTLIGGGLGVAFLKILYDEWKGRVQRVHYRMSTDSVFSSSPHQGFIGATAHVSYHGTSFHYENLSLVRIDIKNKSFTDLEAMTFGIELDGEHKMVSITCTGQDRHHVAKTGEGAANPSNPSKTIDVECKPFNRGDEYSFRLYVQTVGSLTADQVKFSSVMPIRFAEMDERSRSVSTQATMSMIFSILGAAFFVLVFIPVHIFPHYFFPPSPEAVIRQANKDIERATSEIKEAEEKLAAEKEKKAKQEAQHVKPP